MKKFRELYAIAVMVCAFFLCTCLPARAEESDCYGGRWELVESVRDRWSFQGIDRLHYTYGISMSFWESPTFCNDIRYDFEGNRIEYTKSLVCVQPSYTKILYVPLDGDCEISGKAVSDPYFPASWHLSPCSLIDHLPPHPASNYGEVTIANSMKKYKRICPGESFPQNANLGAGDGCL